MAPRSPTLTTFPTTGEVVVFDTEQTAWEGAMARRWSGPGEYREIIQIGGVRVDAGAGFRERAAFVAWLRPTLNPVLSDYITGLTGITQDTLARRGVSLDEGMAAFAAFAAGVPALSFGDDGMLMHDNFRLVGRESVLGGVAFQDMRSALMRAVGRDPAEPLSSCHLPACVGLAFEGQTHDALADSRALVAVMRTLRHQGAL